MSETQLFMLIFLIFPLFLVFGGIKKILKVIKYKDVHTFTAHCTKIGNDKVRESDGDYKNSKSIYISYIYDCKKYNNIRFVEKYTSNFKIGEPIEIYIDKKGNPCQKIQLKEEIINLVFTFGFAIGLTIFFFVVLWPLGV